MTLTYRPILVHMSCTSIDRYWYTFVVLVSTDTSTRFCTSIDRYWDVLVSSNTSTYQYLGPKVHFFRNVKSETIPISKLYSLPFQEPFLWDSLYTFILSNHRSIIKYDCQESQSAGLCDGLWVYCKHWFVHLRFG